MKDVRPRKAGSNSEEPPSFSVTAAVLPLDTAAAAEGVEEGILRQRTQCYYRVRTVEFGRSDVMAFELPSNSYSVGECFLQIDLYHQVWRLSINC